MENPWAQRAGTAAAVVMAFLVGMLLGGEFCHEPDEPPPVAEVECPDPSPQIVLDCPTEPEPEELAEAPPPRSQPAQRDPGPSGRVLPDSPPPPDPRQRSRLLGWARGEATSLQACPRDPGTTYRIAVTLHVRDGLIDDVSINADDSELPPDLHRCIRTRIADWSIPDSLVPEQDRVVFRLTL
jgi:hypothetical protein